MSRFIFFVLLCATQLLSCHAAVYRKCVINNGNSGPTCSLRQAFSVVESLSRSCDDVTDQLICLADEPRTLSNCGCVKRPAEIREVVRLIDRVIYAPPIYINRTIVKPIFINNTAVCMQNDSIVVDMRACRSNDTNSTIVTLYESCVNATYYNSTLEIPDVITLNNTFYDSYNETEYEEEYITVEKHAAIIGLTVLAVFEALLLIAAIITIAILTARMKKMRDELERNNSRLGSSVIPLREFSEFD